jgi:predicted alpha/beta superfamily hydrolase
MKKIGSLVLVIAMTSTLSIIICSVFTDDESAYEDRVVKVKLFSNVLGEERELIIHLPGGYDSTKRYPVMYVLDGSSQDRPIAAKFDVLTAAGYTPSTMVVGISNMRAENREKNLTPPFMRRDHEALDSKWGEADKFLEFMETELFPYMEKDHGASRVRLLSGNSRGGLLAMYSLISKPDLFQARFCFSAPFWRQDNILVSKVDDFLNSTDTLHTFIYMSAGEKETENIRNGLIRMTNVLKKKTPVGLIFYADFTPEAIHQNNALISAWTGIARWSEYQRSLKREKSPENVQSP